MAAQRLLAVRMATLVAVLLAADTVDTLAGFVDGGVTEIAADSGEPAAELAELGVADE